ncbi:MAG: 7-cyano-7-deazaguanine synthase QueC [candidate division Zixibacteria bacterium]|nr:7-cyano-7-deazaguanine synthase QueC [candidate division Zixibacteria bacterium]
MSDSKIIVLLSGGLDSATTAAIAKKEGCLITALSFDYGQRHRIELEAAKKIVKHLNLDKHTILTMDLNQIGGSALTDSIDVPKQRSNEQINEGIPITYVPARNTIFLSYALAVAEVEEASSIYIGANSLDYSGYPDCRPEFIEAFEKLANLATKTAVEGSKIQIKAPLIDLSKAEIIKRGTELGLDYSLTFSCYDPVKESLACGECDSCILRKKGFLEASVPDPTNYAQSGQ